MARPNPAKSAHRSSPQIDEDGDILVSSASSASSEFDPEFDSSELSASGEKSPRVYSKSHTPPSTSHPVADSINTHTTPTLRAARREPKVLAHTGSPPAAHPLDHRRVPFPVDSALRDALHEGEPVLTAIFGKAVVRALNEFEESLPGSLSVSNDEHSIQAAVWIAASTGLSKTDHVTLKRAAKQVKDKDQWDRIIKEGKAKMDPENYPATVLGNADLRCKMVFRLLQML